jgi:hypothetical protein
MNKLLISLALAAALLTNVSAAGDSIVNPVVLIVTNDTPSTLRCTALVAHFVSSNLGRLPPGRQLSLPLSRHEPGGSLAYGSHRDQPMWLENIVCGVDDDWTATRVDIPLQRLRESSVSQVRISCLIRATLTCQPLGER